MSTRCTTFAPSSTWETRSVLVPSLSSNPSYRAFLLPFPRYTYASPRPSVSAYDLSLSLSLSVFRALPPLLPCSRGQNINDRANHPEHEHRATPRGEEGGEACNCRELAKCRIGGGTMGECVHGTGRIPGRRGVAVQAAGMVLRCLSITLRQLPPFVIVARSRFR